MARVKCIDPLLRVSAVLLKEGLLPTDKFEKRHIIKLTIHTMFYSLITALNVTNSIHAIRERDGMALNRVTSILIPIAHMWAKVSTLFINKGCFLLLLDDLTSDAFNRHSERLNQHIQFVYKISELLWKYYAFVISAFLFVTAVLPFVTKIRMMMPPPFDVGKYGVVYKIIHLCIVVYLSLNSICFDVLYMSLLALCIAQLNILQDRLMGVFEEAREKCGNVGNINLNSVEEHLSKSYTKIEQEIVKQCIVLHEKINGFVTNLSVVLSFPLFVQYVCGCFVICNSIVLVTIMGETNTTNIIGIIAYCIIMFSQLTVYHWLGNEIIFKSNNITNACYLSNWYKLNRRSQKSLLLLMERTKRPLSIQLRKLIFISLESLGVIVRWSYSLFALIKARYS